MWKQSVCQIYQNSSCHLDWRRILFSERLVSMEEVFHVDARDSCVSSELLSSDSIRVVDLVDLAL